MITRLSLKVIGPDGALIKRVIRTAGARLSHEWQLGLRELPWRMMPAIEGMGLHRKSKAHTSRTWNASLRRDVSLRLRWLARVEIVRVCLLAMLAVIGLYYANDPRPDSVSNPTRPSLRIEMGAPKLVEHRHASNVVSGIRPSLG